MQTLDIISVNIWQILISLCNLLIIFLVVKKFLFGPIQSVMEKRQAEIDEHYKTAEEAEKLVAELTESGNGRWLVNILGEKWGFRSI